MPTNQLVLSILLGASLCLNVVLLLRGGPSDEGGNVPASTAPIQEAAVKTPPAEATRPQTAAEAGGDVPAAEERAPEDLPSGEWTIVRGKVEQSLARTFQVEAGESGDALASVYTRLFVWDIDMRRDLQPGDTVAVVWRPGPDGFPEIAAASLQTRKLGRTVAAYRWKAPGDAYPSYWHPDGTEAALRLKGGPIEKYEQITSLLKDRPTHKGMDFKTPVGTEITAPRDGTVTRANWNWGANGNCLEIRYSDGVLAKFLHLSENKVKEGDRVKTGQVIALSGNTGRSTAPHLHYQLDTETKTLDPLDYHGTERRSLDAAKVDALRADVAEFEKLLGSGTAG